ncbi:MAG: phosphatidylserine decarboxylase family protein [Desulfobacterales bacterium]|nr:phosphatidylserine decarboxylase family protein [Desulfobacterales bacterium]
MKNYTWPEPPNQSGFNIAKPGYPYITAGVFATAIFAIIHFTLFAFISIIATFFCCWFFRDPDRVIPTEPEVIISPADGKIIKNEISECPFIEGKFQKVSIFMNVFNVHVNRIPFGGVIKKIIYLPGKFFSANLDKASEENEQNALIINTTNEKTICVVQIAGLVARRIICYIASDDEVKQGTRYGMICFGSRLDVYMPLDANITAKIGEKVKAGTSIIGYMA